MPPMDSRKTYEVEVGIRIKMVTPAHTALDAHRLVMDRLGHILEEPGVTMRELELYNSEVI